MKVHLQGYASTLNDFCALSQKPKTAQTFQELRKRHGITLQTLCSMSGLTIYTLRLLDEFNEVTPAVFDVLLTIVSSIAGHTYTRSDVGAVKFVAKPDLSKVLLSV